MILDADRLKEFAPRSRKSDAASGDLRMLEAAQDVGVAIKMMRKACKMRVGTLADQIGVRVEDLKRAEAGKSVERTGDGRLIDTPGALLVLVARVTGHKSIPLP